MYIFDGAWHGKSVRRRRESKTEMAVVVEHVEIVAALLERVGVAQDAATCRRLRVLRRSGPIGTKPFAR